MKVIKENLDDQVDTPMDDQLDRSDSEEDQVDQLLLLENNEERDEARFDLLLNRFQESLSQLRCHNKEELEKQYSEFTNAYYKAEDVANVINLGRNDQVERPNFPYNPTKLHEYGLDFLSFVDPHFVADIKKNYEWYL